MVEVNVYGPLALYQATCELLMAAEEPKFVFLSTRMGSIGRMEKAPFPVGAYGATKAMMNHLVRKMHFETERLIAFSIYPG
jgi:norsolorinic acid ketoreductase